MGVGELKETYIASLVYYWNRFTYFNAEETVELYSPSVWNTVNVANASEVTLGQYSMLGADTTQISCDTKLWYWLY